MFDEIRGIPAHPLLLHAAVIFIPLLAFGSICYIVVPVLRPRIRWVVALLAAVAPASAVLTKLSGDALRTRLMGHGVSGQTLVDINRHRDLGNLTMWLTIGLAAVTVFFLLGTASNPAEPPRDKARRFWVPVKRAPYVLLTILGVLAAGLALASLYYVFQTGDLGAHLRWDGV